MSPLTKVSPEPVEHPGAPRATILLIATACALVVANLYYAQPLAGPISVSLGLSPALPG